MTYTTVQITREYHEKLKEIADRNKRTLSGQIEYWIEQETNQEQEKIMLLSEYIKQDSTKEWEYVGTMWGGDPVTFTKRELVRMLTKELPDTDGEMIDHPTRQQGSGYYIQSDAVWYIDDNKQTEQILIPA